MTSNTMDTLDLKKTYKTLFSAPATAPILVDVPPLSYLMLDGQGDPNTSPAYEAAVQTLYSVAYTLRFALKKAAVLDYTVPPLEGLWWAKDMGAFLAADREAWQWTMMILTPEAVTREWFDKARAEARAKGAPAIERLRLETYAEGLSAHIMHIGPYAAEAPTIERLHAFIAAEGYAPAGKHHEIYLGDPRRTAAEKLKTIIRQPVARP